MVCLFPSVTAGNTSLEYYVQIEELFNVTHEVYDSLSHGGRNHMVNEIGLKYKKNHSRMYYGLFKFMHSLSQKVESY